MKVSHPIILPGKNNYLVAYTNNKKEIVYEMCTREALRSRLANRFRKKGRLISSIQVWLLNKNPPPYFEEINEEKLIGMYRPSRKDLKKDLEQRVSS